DGRNPVFDWGEDFQKLLHDGIQGFAEASWGFIQEAFSASDLDDHWWASVVGGEIETVVNGEVVSTIDHPGMLNVVVVALIPLLLVFIAIQVIMSMLRGSSAGLLRALAMAVFALPTTYIVTGMVWLVVTGMDEVSLWILETGEEDGTDEAMSGLLALFGMMWDSDAQEVLLDENYVQWKWAVQDGDVGRVLVSFLLGLVIWFVCLVLILMMVFRLVGILIFTVFMLAAIFVVSFEGSNAIFCRLFAVVVDLVLGVKMDGVLIIVGLVLSSLGGNKIESALVIVIILVAAAMPLVLATLFADVSSGRSTTDNQAGAGIGRNMDNSLERGNSRASRS